ncbi:MAG: SDR family oxidoreductase, partial [Chloroflexi bacterium]|nr:SDR family oxidoreductase [Chloroflexota bacterium]
MPRRLNEQVVVITGASSGIGRQTALQFGEAGASVVLAARNETALHEVAEQIRQHGGQAMVVVTDVAQWSQVEHLAQQAASTFGRIDTWINDASVALYAPVEDATVEELERIIQVDLLDMIYGVKAVLPHMKRQGYGTIINVGSVLSERSVPLQAAYNAAKHGVKGFTETLRMEMKHHKTGIDVTLIMPASINTPFFNHARSKLGVKPQPIPPVYEPKLVADAILHAAQNPKRTIHAGGAGVMMGALQRISPRLTDRFMLMRGNMFKQQKTDQPDDGQDNLYAPFQGQGRVQGDFSSKPSLYTRLVTLRPGWQLVV